MRLLSLFLIAVSAVAAERFVSPSGSGDGTLASPWSLTAGCTDSNVSDGDIIYLRGGSYVTTGGLTCNLAGSSGSRITMRNYPGETPVLSSATCTGSTPVILVTGQYTTYEYLEVTLANSCNDRTYAATFRTSGIELSSASANNRVILNRIHDTGQGLIDSGATNEYSDNLVYNTGKANIVADVQNGHCFYPSLGSSASIVKRNICVNTYGFGFHGFNTDPNGYNLDSNLIGRTGLLSGSVVGPLPAILISDQNGSNVRSFTINANMLYSPTSYTGRSSFTDATMTLGDTGTGTSGYGTFTITNNYMTGGVPTWRLVGADTVTMTGNVSSSNNLFANVYTVVVWSPVNTNTYNGDNVSVPGSNWAVNGSLQAWVAGWKALGWDAAGTFNTALPSTNQNFVLASIYDANRGIIGIFNWAGGNTATVDISSVAAAGKYVSIYNAQNYPAGPIWTGVYAGGNITLPTNGASVAPIGDSALSPDVKFGAYIMQFDTPTFRRQSM